MTEVAQVMEFGFWEMTYDGPLLNLLVIKFVEMHKSREQGQWARHVQLTVFLNLWVGVGRVGMSNGRL